MSNPPSQRACLSDWLSCAALLLITLCHLRSVGFGFLDWDDPHTSPRTSGHGAVPLRDHLTTPAIGYPIPITIASYAGAAAARPRGLALPPVNVFAHTFNCAAARVGAAAVVVDRRAGCAVVVRGIRSWQSR
jgi:hypothetical protein